MIGKLCLAWLIAGCAIDGIDGIDDLGETSVDVQPLFGGGHCQGLVCPGNSDLIAALEPYELSTNPDEVSKRGFSITKITHRGGPLVGFHVAGTMPTAFKPGVGWILGYEMIGTVIQLHHTSGEDLELHITDYMPVPYYAILPLPGISGYKLQYRTVGVHEPLQDVCPYTEVSDGGIVGTWGVLWRGDRYDPDTGAIFASGAEVGAWFNVSCAGEATIKMLRTGTGFAVAPASPVSQRQATLNMFTARYCPGPKRYTKLGQALDWDDKTGSNELGFISSYEAVWDESGAVCLNTPRMVARDKVGCAIATCTHDLLAQWKDHGWLRSGNPLVIIAQPAP